MAFSFSLSLSLYLLDRLASTSLVNSTRTNRRPDAATKDRERFFSLAQQQPARPLSPSFKLLASFASQTHFVWMHLCKCSKSGEKKSSYATRLNEPQYLQK